MINRSLRIASLSLTIFHLTEMNTVVLDKGGQSIFVYERNHLPDFLSHIQEKDLKILQAKAKENRSTCHLYTNEYGFSYLGCVFHVNGEEDFVLVNGPFLQQTPNMDKLKVSLINLEPQNNIILQEFFRGLKLINNSQVQSIANVLYKLSIIQQAPIQVVNKLNTNDTTSFIETILQQPDEEYIKLIELKYDIKNSLVRGIEQGDMSIVNEYLTEARNFYDYYELFPHQPVRAMKNMLLSLNTTLHEAAERGKVPPFFLHHISEKFSIKIEGLESIDHLSQLIVDMCQDYCELVHQHNLSEYTLLTSKAIHYLKIYFNQPFDLKKLAKYCFVHPVHLSRQFKKETGMTITEFLQKERVEEAKRLLKKNNAPISWIAGYVGFEDSGYFSRVFKKLEGMTPSQYRDNIPT
jgi:two-component system, response regulator YesN